MQLQATLMLEEFFTMSYHILKYLKVWLLSSLTLTVSRVVFLYQRDLGGFDLNTAGVNITRVISD